MAKPDLSKLMLAEPMSFLKASFQPSVPGSTRLSYKALEQHIQSLGYTNSEIKATMEEIIGFVFDKEPEKTSGQTSTATSEAEENDSSPRKWTGVLKLPVKAMPGTYRYTTFGDMPRDEVEMLSRFSIEPSKEDWNHRRYTRDKETATAQLLFSDKDGLWHLQWTMAEGSSYNFAFWLEKGEEKNDQPIYKFSGSIKSPSDSGAGTFVEGELEELPLLTSASVWEAFVAIAVCLLFMAGLGYYFRSQLKEWWDGVFNNAAPDDNLSGLRLVVQARNQAQERAQDPVQDPENPILDNSNAQLVAHGDVHRQQEPRVRSEINLDDLTPDDIFIMAWNISYDIQQFLGSEEELSLDLQELLEALRKRGVSVLCNNAKLQKYFEDDESEGNGGGSNPSIGSNIPSVVDPKSGTQGGKNGNNASPASGTAGKQNRRSPNASELLDVTVFQTNLVIKYIDGFEALFVEKLQERASKILQNSFTQVDVLEGKVTPPSEYLLNWQTLAVDALAQINITLLVDGKSATLFELENRYIDLLQPHVTSALQGRLTPVYVQLASSAQGKMHLALLGTDDLAGAVIAKAVRCSLCSQEIGESLASESRRAIISKSMGLSNEYMSKDPGQSSLAVFRAQEEIESMSAKLQGSVQLLMDKLTQLAASGEAGLAGSKEKIAEELGLVRSGDILAIPMATLKSYGDASFLNSVADFMGARDEKAVKAPDAKFPGQGVKIGGGASIRMEKVYAQKQKELIFCQAGTGIRKGK